jgi:UDP-N-acetylglucosamine diphosphorylase/glucosamine-1-phosphate N-acetyltransferase
MNIILFDTESTRKQLKPFTLTRPVSELRLGLLSITEKWQAHFPTDQLSILSSLYLMEKHHYQHEEDNIFINGAVIPTKELIIEINGLQPNQGLTHSKTVLAFRSSSFMSMYEVKSTETPASINIIKRAWNLIQWNSEEITNDISLLGLTPSSINDKYTAVYGEDVYLGKNTNIRNASINTTKGPVYIGDNVEINEGAVIHGPVAIAKDSVISIGAKIRNNVSIGENCVIGGEVKDSILFNNTNKAHEGYMGNSVIGEWCNFGAGTNISNLKNNLSKVRVYDYQKHEYINSGEQKLGLLMGDYSMTAIGTNFMTGSTVGVSSNIIHKPEKYTASFSWSRTEKYNLSKVITKAIEFSRLKGKALSDAEILILEYICTT